MDPAHEVAGARVATMRRRLAASKPTTVQRHWLARALGQPGGKLPLFDENGKRIGPRTVRRCLDEGWAEPWFSNPIKPDWVVCRLTPAGRAVSKTSK